jgi:excisionase family DNA binding protein
MMEKTRTYSSTEAGAALGVSSQAVRRWVEEGKLTARHIGLRRILRIEETELERFASQNKIHFEPKNSAENG